LFCFKPEVDLDEFVIFIPFYILMQCVARFFFCSPELNNNNNNNNKNKIIKLTNMVQITSYFEFLSI